jgi:DNA repair protein RadA
MSPDDDLEKIPGVSRTITAILQNGGYTSRNQLAEADPDTLAEDCNINVASAENIVQTVQDTDTEGDTEGLFRGRHSLREFSTGSDAVDGMFGGGIPTKRATEFFGPLGSGRTALAHLLAVRAQLPASAGGLGDHVIYIDTRGNFDPHRILEIVGALSSEDRQALAAHLDVDDDDYTLGEAVLERIYLFRTPFTGGQLLAGEQIQELATAPGLSVGLIVEDSLTFLPHHQYPGSIPNSNQEVILNHHLNHLTTIAELVDAALVLTNETTSAGDPRGGYTVAYRSSYRVKIRKTSGEKLRYKLIDAVDLPVDEVGVYFNNGRLTTSR